MSFVSISSAAIAASFFSASRSAGLNRVFFIPPPFSRCRPSRSYDSDPTAIVLGRIGMHDNEKNDHMQWIVPDPSSEFEGHAVFDKILPSFCRTPFKPHRVLWRIYVRTFLSI